MVKQNFSEKLIEVRKAKGLTQEEVAEKCKINVRTIQRIESGAVNPRAFTIKIISDALGFDFFETSNTGYEVERGNQDSDFKKRTILWFVKDLFNFKTNTMRKVSILLAFLLLVLGLFIIPSRIIAQSGNNEAFKSLTIKHNDDKTIKRIEFVISHDLTIDSLVRIKTTLAEKGITLNYKKIDFDDDNRLISIDCDVNCNDGYSGGFGIDDLESLSKKEKVGFYRDYTPNAKSSFGTGGIRY